MWSPASRVIGHEGSEKQDVWVLCEGIPLLVSSQNMRPATDAEALAHAVLHDEPVVPDAVVRGAQSFEDARDAPPADGAEEPENREAAGALDDTMTCHPFRLCWRKSLLTRNDVVLSVEHVLQTNRARHAVCAKEGRAG